MGCGMEMIKCVLFLFNLAFALSGLALLTAGIIYKLQLDEYSQYMDPTITVAPNLLIGVGAVIFIVAFFGCCGAIQENHCMIVTYATILLTILIVEVALGVYIYIQSDGNNEYDKTIRKEFTKVFNQYHKDAAAEKSINSIQSALLCCGVDGPLDYGKSFADLDLPKSCCPDPNILSCNMLTNHWQDGCFEKLDKLKDAAAELLGSIVIGVGAVEIIGIVFSLCLANSIKNTERRLGV